MSRISDLAGFTTAITTTEDLSVGVVTASSFSGSLTGNATGLSGTPDITVNNITGAAFTASSGNITGALNVGGVLTYADVTNVDSVGMVTARKGLQVLADGANITGIATVSSDVSIADKIIHTGDTNTAIRFPAADTFTVETGGSEALRVDSSQRLLRGTTSAETFRANITPSLQIEGTSSNTGSASLFVNSDDSSGPFFVMGKSRATSANGDTVVQDNDGCGTIQWVAADGTDRASRVALIAAHIDGTPGSNDTPGRLIFSTTADGASTSTERARITSSGNMGVGENSPQQRLHVSSTSSTYIQVQNTGDSVNAYYGVDTASAWAGSSTNHPFKLHTNNTERLRIDTSGRLLCGHTSSIDTGGVESHLQVVGTDTEKSSLCLARFVNDSGEPFLIFAKSRNGSKGGNTVVQDDDTLGRVSFQGADGSDYEEAASIKGEVDGTPADEATDMPGRLLFGTTANGDHNATERLRIDSRGSFQFSNGFMNETVKINTTARTGTQAVNLDDGMVHYFSTNSAGTWKPNFTMSAGNDINATIAIGDVFSPTMIVAKGADTHFANSAEVDGTTIASIEFLGGAPTDGGASGKFDIYTYSIIKTGDDAFKAFVAVSTYE